MATANNAWDAGSGYERLGVAPIINAAGSITRLGGSRTRPETLELMSRAARVMVNIDDLNRAAGKELARLTGAELDLSAVAPLAAWCCRRRPS